MISIDIAHVPLSRGMYAKVNQEDLAVLLDYVWHAIPQGKKWRARGYKRGDGSKKRIYMHTLLTGSPYIDHEDKDPLNNTRSNLIASSHTSNMRNVTSASNTGHVGVVWIEKRGYFIAQLSIGKRGHAKNYSKWFRTLDEAIEYRKQLEQLHWHKATA